MDWQPVQGAPHLLPKHSWENQSVFYIWKNLSRGQVGWNNLAARPCLTFDLKNLMSLSTLFIFEIKFAY